MDEFSLVILGLKFRKRDAGIVERKPVGIEATSVLSEDGDLLGDVIDDVAKLLLGVFQLLDVGNSPVPSDENAVLVAEGFGAKEKPAVFPVHAAQARFCLSGLAGSQNRLPVGRQRLAIFRMD